ncbi:MAG: peptide ABC transporter substrate-binding protein [Chloroflexota bacterium]|jgi:oligopeptide transport system substrate-binding protein|nr:peptide ABC transporter substrate-binding protein [Anaerolineae bacterium]HMM29012.1 peptide ABC transporter substrate-binding protein [Aggregatilineaceae bacterium]
MHTFARRTARLAVILAMTAAALPTGFVFASDADVTLVSVMQQTEPITVYTTAASEISTLDPQRASDQVSIAAIEQLFLGLTDNDPLNPGNILPELATAWEYDETGTVWTFTIRNDVPWVRWDPVTDQAEQLGFVTAHDIAYGMKRACDPRLGAYYTSVADKVILGCDEVSTKPVSEVTDADYDLVQVFALDDTTLEVHLQFSAGFFFSQTPMWMYRPVPRSVIEELGDDWTEPGNLVTNGPFVLDEWQWGGQRVYLRNPLLPEDLRGPGNVERVIQRPVFDLGTTFALYQENSVDASGVPPAELQSILNDPAYADQLSQSTSMSVFYFGFAHDKPPFDNVHARRAFSAAVDRTAFALQQGSGEPMIHLTPPIIPGAPPINEVGVGYNPELARAEIEAAGYPNCEGLPPLLIVSFVGSSDWAEFLAASVERELGCDPSLLTVEQQEFSVLLETIDPRNAPEDRPNIWTLGWGPDYPDANNWVGDVLHCESENTFKRPCSAVDDLISQAARETDPALRNELYYRIEEMFFGPEGEHPLISLFLDRSYVLQKPWYSGPFQTDGIFGGPHYNYRMIDQAAQLAARGS